MISRNREEVEEDRLAALALARESLEHDGETLEGMFGDTSEALLDRAFVQQSVWDEFVQTNPACLLRPGL